MKYLILIFFVYSLIEASKINETPNNEENPFRLVGWGKNKRGFIPDGSHLYYSTPTNLNLTNSANFGKSRIKSTSSGVDFSLILTGILNDLYPYFNIYFFQ